MKNIKLKLSAVIMLVCLYVVFALLWNANPFAWPASIKALASWIGATGLIFIIICPREVDKRSRV